MSEELLAALKQLAQVFLSLFSGLLSGLKDILGDTEPIPTAVN